MRRREFITLLGGAAAWPMTARAQQRAMPVVGFFEATASPDGYAPMVAAFRQGLGEGGFIVGRNVTIEYQWAGNQSDLGTLAADLVRRQVSVIAVGGVAAIRAAKDATTIIPIVFRIGIDPVDLGLVGSLNRPGGNLTGVVTLAVELAPKRLELLRELVPAASVVALLVNPRNTNFETLIRDVQRSADSLGLRLNVLRASTEPDLDSAFAGIVASGTRALVIGSDGFFNSRMERLATLSLRHAVPTIYQYREFATAGGLMSYGGSLTDAYRLAGVYTGRVLKGEKPADLPVQQSTKVELIVNLKSAKALGLTVPLALLTRADEVIE
jgi:putative tryptophan/tyrosine transport system substrate-binding protein